MNLVGVWSLVFNFGFRVFLLFVLFCVLLVCSCSLFAACF